jgi:hypothetical protein
MSQTFNGTSSQLVSAAKLLTATYPTSMFCWMKPTTSSPDKFVLAHGESLYEHGIYATPTKVRGWTYDGGGSANPNSTSSIVTTWQPVLVVWTDATNTTVYYSSGAAVTANPAVSARTYDTSARLYVGRRAISATYFFAGDIAEVGLWSSALTQANFDSLAAGATPESVATGSLVDVWSLETATDLTGRVAGNVLTATSVTTGATHPITRSGGGSGGPSPFFNRPMLGGNFQG